MVNAAILVRMPDGGFRRDWVVPGVQYPYRVGATYPMEIWASNTEPCDLPSHVLVLQNPTPAPVAGAAPAPLCHFQLNARAVHFACDDRGNVGSQLTEWSAVTIGSGGFDLTLPAYRAICVRGQVTIGTRMFWVEQRDGHNPAPPAPGWPAPIESVPWAPPALPGAAPGAPATPVAPGTPASAAPPAGAAPAAPVLVVPDP